MASRPACRGSGDPSGRALALVYPGPGDEGVVDEDDLPARPLEQAGRDCGSKAGGAMDPDRALGNLTDVLTELGQREVQGPSR